MLTPFQEVFGSTRGSQPPPTTGVFQSFPILPSRPRSNRRRDIFAFNRARSQRRRAALFDFLSRHGYSRAQVLALNPPQRISLLQQLGIFL